MSIFGTIMSKIFHHAQTAPAQSKSAGASAQVSSPAPTAAPTAPSAQATPGQPVDVEAVLTQMAESKSGGGNWRLSIVDLLKLLDLDSSVEARKQLADELNVHAGSDGSAEENIALHKAVMDKLAENGGKVPADLRS